MVVYCSQIGVYQFLEEAVSISETFVSIYKNTQINNPEKLHA
jgi:hypothetical protein